MKINVKQTSIKFLLAATALLILLSVLNNFGIINMGAYISPIIMIMGAMFVVLEIGFASSLKNKPVKLIGLFVAMLALVSAIFPFIGWNIPALIMMQGMIGTALLIFVVVEIFQ